MTQSSAVVADQSDLENNNMRINHKLIALGLAFSLLGSPCAFARPMPHFENGGLSHEKKTVESHVPARPFGATGCAHQPSAATGKSNSASNMLLTCLAKP